MKQILLLVLLNVIVGSVTGQTIDVTLKLADNCNKVATDVIPEPDSDVFLKLFPNPSMDEFTLSANLEFELGNATIDIYNIDGRLVYNEIIYCNSKFLIKKINTSKLPDGLYIIKIKSEGLDISSKFIKQNN